MQSLLTYYHIVAVTGFWPYRQAGPATTLFLLDRTKFKDLERRCYELRPGVMPGNHATFQVTISDGGTLVLLFSDQYIYVGLTVNDKPW